MVVRSLPLLCWVAQGEKPLEMELAGSYQLEGHISIICTKSQELQALLFELWPPSPAWGVWWLLAQSKAPEGIKKGRK